MIFLKQEKNKSFEDLIPFIRLISIYGIIIIHSLSKIILIKNQNTILFSSIISLFKYSTYFFFILSGYLFQKNFIRYQKKDVFYFLYSKICKILLPFLIIVLIPNIFLSTIKFCSSTNIIHLVIKNLILIISWIIYSEYWFILVIFLYYIVNFFLQSKNLFIAFAISILITILYTIRIEFNLSNEPSHTSAFFAYLSFFLFGRLFYYKYEKIKELLNSHLSMLIFFNLLIIFINYLYIVRFKLELNTLRIGYILYGFLLFLLVLKLESKIKMLFKLNKIKVEYHYYVFLIHIYVINYSFKFFIYNSFISINYLHVFVLIFLIIFLSFKLSKLIYNLMNRYIKILIT